VISVQEASDFNVDYVFMQPGEWGRYGGLPVLRSGVDLLMSMGITIMRYGGTFCSDPDDGSWYQWQKWTGPREFRNATIRAGWNTDLIEGFGPFEFIDMCNAAAIEPVVTLTETSSPASLAALVEYCWGDKHTPMGKKRHEDGHPGQYRVKIFELGNEEYNAAFIEQVEAMEAKAQDLKLQEEILYMFPSGPPTFSSFLNSTDLARAARLSRSFPTILSRMAADIHVSTGGAVPLAKQLFELTGDFPVGAVNGEVNGGFHHMTRAMQEASDMLSWFNADLANLYFRTTSFCSERSGHYDGSDQGIAFFLPNQTWLQPPGWVHAMISSTFESKGLLWNDTTPIMPSPLPQLDSLSGELLTVPIIGADGAHFSAAKRGDKHNKGAAVSAWFLNDQAVHKHLTISVNSTTKIVWAKVQELATPKYHTRSANSPGRPLELSPKAYNITTRLGRNRNKVVHTVPPYSFAAFQIKFANEE